MVAGFPEIVNREPKCKLCQLCQRDRGLLKLVHRMRHEEELGNSALRTKVRAVFERQGQPVPSPRSFGRHFEEHVDFSRMPDPDALAMPEPVETTLHRLESDADGLRMADPEELALGRNHSDYHQLTDLFVRLTRRITALDSDPRAFINQDGSHSFQKLSTWAGLIDNARRIIEGLNKMRNSDRMTVSILETHTRRLATSFTRPVATEMRMIRDQLLTSSDPTAQRVATHMTALLDDGVPTIITDAATKAMRESREEFKLLN